MSIPFIYTWVMARFLGGLEKAIFRQEWCLTQAISALRGLRQDLAARLG